MNECVLCNVSTLTLYCLQHAVLHCFHCSTQCDRIRSSLPLVSSTHACSPPSAQGVPPSLGSTLPVSLRQREHCSLCYLGRRHSVSQQAAK